MMMRGKLVECSRKSQDRCRLWNHLEGGWNTTILPSWSSNDVEVSQNNI